MKKRVAVYIGRFQPLHYGHLHIIKESIKHFDTLIVLIGSANKRLSMKDPFSITKRKEWISAFLRESDVVEPINDFLYNDQKWAAQVNEIVSQYANEEDVTIVGHHKDDTSFYLDMFPRWKSFEFEDYKGISGTDIRELLYEEKIEEAEGLIPKDVLEGVRESIASNPNFDNIIGEYVYYKEEKERFRNYPYPHTLKFLTADAVVMCNGYVLLIRRKFNPGKDIWALPGGFVNQKESTYQAAVRELYEETNLRVPEKVLHGSLKNKKLFDNPRRTLGIPRVTNAFHFEVSPDQGGKLPRANGGDDAAESRWFSLSEVKKMKLFDDHADIIDYFIGAF